MSSFFSSNGKVLCQVQHLSKTLAQFAQLLLQKLPEKPTHGRLMASKDLNINGNIIFQHNYGLLYKTNRPTNLATISAISSAVFAKLKGHRPPNFWD